MFSMISILFNEVNVTVKYTVHACVACTYMESGTPVI